MAVIFAYSIKELLLAYSSSSGSQTPPGKTNAFENDMWGLRLSISNRWESAPLSAKVKTRVADCLRGFIFDYFYIGFTINIYKLNNNQGKESYSGEVIVFFHQFCNLVFNFWSWAVVYSLFL